MEGYTLFIPQCFISARRRHQSLLQNLGDMECVCVCVCVCVGERERERARGGGKRERQRVCVRESSGGAMWYRWGPGLVFVWNQAWCLVSSANISSARLPLQLHSNRESSLAALPRLLKKTKSQWKQPHLRTFYSSGLPLLWHRSNTFQLIYLWSYLSPSFGLSRNPNLWNCLRKTCWQQQIEL